MEKRFEQILKRRWVIFAAAAAVLAAAAGGTYALSQQTAPSEGLRESVAQATAGFLGEEHNFIIDNIVQVRNWAFGTIAVPAPPDVHAEPRGYLWFARYRGEQDGWQVAVEGSALYVDWLRQAPAGVVDRVTQGILISAYDPTRALPDSILSLPWATGETWTLTGGPHNNAGCFDGNCGPGSPRPWSALDFAGSSGVVRAAADGVAWRICANFVRVDHANGYQTGYYHLVDIPVSNAQSVTRGQMVGRQSAQVGCGGAASGPHVHFSLRYQGVHQAIDGYPVGGWLPVDGSSQYSGCMQRISDGYLRCQMGQIYNDGTIGYDSSVVVEPTPTPPPPSDEAPADINLIRNGSFSAESDWRPWGDLVYELQDGVLSFYHAEREEGGWASVRQQIAYGFPEAAPVELSARLGNASTSEKVVNLVLHPPDGFETYVNCLITLPPGTPLNTYRLRASLPQAYDSLMFEVFVETPDGVPAITMDDVTLVYRPGAEYPPTECIVPPDQPPPERPDDEEPEVGVQVQLMSPLQGGTLTPYPVVFQWEPYPDARNYTLFVTDLNGQLNQVRVSTRVCSETLCELSIPRVPLVDGRQHSWAVRANLTDGTSVISETITFTVDLSP